MWKTLILSLTLLVACGTPQVVLDIEGKITGYEGMTFFYVNGELIDSVPNTVTDTLLNEMLACLATGDFDKIQYIGFIHKYSGDAVVTDTLWNLCQYDSGSYDTAAWGSWDITYDCPSINSYDSLTYFYLSAGEATGVYCTQDTTYVLVGDDLLHIVWKFTWQT